MAHLKLVKKISAKDSEAPCCEPQQDAPVVGERYTLNSLPSALLDADGLLGDYKISLRQSEIIAPSFKRGGQTGCYFWHSYLTEAEVASLKLSDTRKRPLVSDHLVANRAMMQSSKLIGPNIINVNNQATLSVTPEFIIHFNTAAGAAELGEIRLIDSSRFITLGSGKTIPVICTDPAEGQALFLDESQDSPLLKQNFIQPSGSNESYVIRRTVNQHLPKTFQGETVECVTVLEHVTSFFMQKLAGSTDAIWTPVMQPISWGWSVRLERAEHNWQITKRRIMRPTSHHDGLKLPEWKTHVREQSAVEWDSFLYSGNPIFNSTTALHDSLELADRF